MELLTGMLNPHARGYKRRLPLLADPSLTQRSLPLRIAHNTLLVDHQSPAHGPFTTRQDFQDDLQYFSIFTFSDYAYLRVEKGATQVRGKVAGFRLPATALPSGGPVTINGTQKDHIAIL